MVWIDGTHYVTCDLAFFAKLAWIVGHTCLRNYTHLLDEVFVISRIMEVEVGVISRRRRLRLITLTEISIILDITKSESNNVFIMHWTEKNYMKVMFLLLHQRQAAQSKRAKVCILQIWEMEVCQKSNNFVFSHWVVKPTISFRCGIRHKDWYCNQWRI